ncbi:phospholipid metabolism-regulating protein scs22 [Saccharomyces pastorianus]|uniref:Phospholipid metabolism-regulating protein scs22 n=1 Tax=Saccharomyces pastorianus TaxID=27292 RepID=A0A6C1E1X4_SACPS|nr:phospholipid metabolism-regulating protein scs22 [Saccharomyces pastorianus]
MRIVPEELAFKAPLNEQSTEYIKLENDGGQRLIFKVRTSAPKSYCVRPNVAIIEAHESTEVQVVFLGLPKSTTEDEIRQRRDKFLIVTLPVPADYADMNDTKLLSNWAKLEERYKDVMVFQKIKVSYSAMPSQKASDRQGSTSTSPAREQGLNPTTLLVMTLVALLLNWLYY